MAIKHTFRASAIATALILAGCGGDININEGDVVNEGDTINNPSPTPTPTPTPNQWFKLVSLDV